MNKNPEAKTPEEEFPWEEEYDPTQYAERYPAHPGSPPPPPHHAPPHHPGPPPPPPHPHYAGHKIVLAKLRQFRAGVDSILNRLQSRY